jgi:hypothetical protein
MYCVLLTYEQGQELWTSRVQIKEVLEVAGNDLE